MKKFTFVGEWEDGGAWADCIEAPTLQEAFREVVVKGCAGLVPENILVAFEGDHQDLLPTLDSWQAVHVGEVKP